MSGRRPEGRGGFLGTQQIVQRLRATRPARFGVPTRPLGGLLAVVVAVWGFNFVRLSLSGGRHPVATPAAPAAAVVSSAPAADDVAAGPEADARTQGRPGAGAASESAGVRLRVVVRGASLGSELRIDGESVGSATRWEGRLSRGPHALSVRQKSGEQSYVVQLQSAQEVVFEVRTRRVHASRLHEHGRKGR